MTCRKAPGKERKPFRSEVLPALRVTLNQFLTVSFKVCDHLRYVSAAQISARRRGGYGNNPDTRSCRIGVARID